MIPTSFLVIFLHRVVRKVLLVVFDVVYYSNKRTTKKNIFINRGAKIDNNNNNQSPSAPFICSNAFQFVWSVRVCVLGIGGKSAIE